MQEIIPVQEKTEYFTAVGAFGQLLRELDCRLLEYHADAGVMKKAMVEHEDEVWVVAAPLKDGDYLVFTLTHLYYELPAKAFRVDMDNQAQWL